MVMITDHLVWIGVDRPDRPYTWLRGNSKGALKQQRSQGLRPGGILKWKFQRSSMTWMIWGMPIAEKLGTLHIVNLDIGNY